MNDDGKHIDWIYMQYLRRRWVRRGDVGVPEERCSCGFEGPGRPEECEVHGRLYDDKTR
jgi:hypothetical protein